MNITTVVSKRKQHGQDLVLTAAEKRLIRAHRNTGDAVQETTVQMIENFALNPALMRHKAPVFQLIAGGRGA